MMRVIVIFLIGLSWFGVYATLLYMWITDPKFGLNPTTMFLSCWWILCLAAWIMLYKLVIDELP